MIAKISARANCGTSTLPNVSAGPMSALPANRARQRSEAADDNDDQRVDEVIHVHARIDPEHRRSDDTGHSRERGADREGDREEAVDVDAERREHRRVIHARADQRADARAPVHECEDDGERGPESDDEQPVHRVVAAQDVTAWSRRRGTGSSGSRGPR